MKLFFEAVGVLTTVLFICGALGFGNFIVKFSTNQIVCTEVTK